ncbi:P pilus assembly protein, pilin FimA [Photorhabdus khanii NC19]|uniref:P pilus assembly protein, pilin FimA n=1 Tax=Photorhabdus khanii NC19 TaxID=1004151 RepID=W3V971_9GAMM|nr:fimbrial protein [Photorhabdus khanii]ETS31584.1 P pilus assembly protein, pilin FimA [Photorhabdus khanii NC19]
MKKILKISVVAALVLGVVSSASAEGQVKKNTEVTITGSVVAATCDVTSPNANGKVDLGNASAGAFEAGTFNDQTSIASYVGTAPRLITVSLINCDDQNTDANKIQLRVSGKTLDGSNNTIFNDSEKGKNVGAILTYENGTKKEVVPNNGYVPLKGDTAAGTGAKGKDFDGYSVTFSAYMASTVLKPGSGQAINAPITFSYAYN